MAKRNHQAEKVYQALAPKIAGMGFVLVDVIYQKENGKLFLRLLVDKKGGISIDECALINETMDPIIDQELGMHDHDYFEVSSPGLDRPISEPFEFELYQGQLVEVKLYQKRNQKKLFSGELLHGDEDTISILAEDTGEELCFTRSEVAKVSRAIRF